MNQLATKKRTIHVMVVDDSAVVRGMVVRALEADPSISIVASVADGEMAVSAIKHHEVDVVVLDVEMPRMDGITALPLLLKASPATRVIMVSSLTMQGADVSLKALSLGAADCMAKPSSTREKEATEQFFKELINKIKGVSGFQVDASWQEVAPLKKADAVPVLASAGLVKPVVRTENMVTRYPNTPPKALAIASSTGGPQALMSLFKGLHGKLQHVPIFITQHMPANFTTILAGNIASSVGRDCHEAKDGEKVQAGVIYMAPGNYHMIPKKVGTDIVISLNQDAPVNFCRPAADPMIDALAQIYGKDLLLAVLTGMGHDGFAGAKRLVERGGLVVAQDEASSVVWGMPRAIIENKIHAAELSIDGFAPYLTKAFGG